MNETPTTAPRVQKPSGGGHRRAPGEVLVVALGFIEYDSVNRQFGAAVGTALLRQLADAFLRAAPAATGYVEEGDHVLIQLPCNPRRADKVLGRIRAVVANADYAIPETQLRVTPIVGFTALIRTDVAEAQVRARQALEEAHTRLDLVPVPWRDHHEAADERARMRLNERIRLWAQVVASFVLALAVPYGIYEVAGALDVAREVTWTAYVTIMLLLLTTSLGIYAEVLAAFDADKTPKSYGADFPSASAIVAAYLPNEAETIVETVEHFLSLTYEAPLQIILTYNTPRPLPVEETLRAIAAADERFVLIKAEGSTSKAQNVNAALHHVSGEFVGIFDADHHPVPGSFQRAWSWLSNGYGVVQGHCLIRNGDSSWVSRTVAVEFEAIYGVSHPGRARLHGFGIFGGSNGYWRTSLLREVRLRGTMLTEDIDSSLRVTLRGERIASDPTLISRELAPIRLSVLAGQRLRWAQGWSQVALEYAVSAVRSRRLSLRQRLGTLFLLCWREINPWASLQMLPLITYVLLHPAGHSFNWFVPLLVVSSLITFMAGPVQTWAAYMLAAPEIRRRRGWFARYLVLNALFYNEFKNTLARVAHLKELMGEKIWRVTVREVTLPDAVGVRIPEELAEVTG